MPLYISGGLGDPGSGSGGSSGGGSSPAILPTTNALRNALKDVIVQGLKKSFPDAYNTTPSPARENLAKMADAVSNIAPILVSYGVSLGEVGSTPNANAATITGFTLNLELANASFPGLMTAAHFTKLTGISAGANVVMVSAPASAGATGVAGQVAYDSSYFYVCTATNTWKRVAIATW